MKDFDSASHERDRRLRFRMLRLLNTARSGAVPIRGHVVRDLVDGLQSGDQFDDDDHVVGLLRDLVNAGYVTTTDRRTHKAQRFGLEHLDCSVTAKGTRFVTGGEPPDSLLDDGRIVP